MKKCFKTLCLLVTAIMLISTVGIASTVSCETGKATYYNGCMYAVYGEEVYITGCDRVTPVLNIPSVIYGRRVTRINDRAFGNCDIITYVSIPSTVEKISPDAFDGCTNLPQIDVDEK